MSPSTTTWTAHLRLEVAPASKSYFPFPVSHTTRKVVVRMEANTGWKNGNARSLPTRNLQRWRNFHCQLLSRKPLPIHPYLVAI